MYTQISSISHKVGESVTLAGWLNNKRSSGSIAFLEIRDGSGYIQAVVPKEEVDDNSWQAVQDLTQESSVKITGVVKAHPKKEGVFELQVSAIEPVQIAKEFPISPKEHGPDFLMDNRHLWLRSKKQWAIQRLRDAVVMAIQHFYHEHGYVRVDTPIFTPNACEGATELFEVPYFDDKLFLSQSGQLYLEAAIMSVGKGYDFGPVFRAEKSKTRKHLTEFWMMDAEAAFVEHAENMDMQEALIKHIVKHCLEYCKEELMFLERDTTKLEGLLHVSFERLTYTDAIARLHELGSDIKDGEDLGADDEELLTKDAVAPMFIHKWPTAIKPFYMKRDPENPAFVLNNDLIGIEGAGEIIGGSQREDDYATLQAAIAHEGLEGPEYQWYLDLRMYGSVPHSGYGLGLERIVRWISGAQHIRETIPFPRMMTRFRP